MRRLLFFTLFTALQFSAQAQTTVSGRQWRTVPRPPQPRIETGQRKGKFFVTLRNYDGRDSLKCTILGSGNMIETDYNAGKVLSIGAQLLKPGNAVVAILSRQTGDTIAVSHTTIRMENATQELPELVIRGSKKKTNPLNPYNKRAPRGYAPGDPHIERAADMRQLLLGLGIRETRDASGEPCLTAIAGNAGVKVFVDNIEETSHDYVLHSIVPANVKAVEYFTPNSAENTVFGVRPASWSGKILGVLFIFLKDGSESAQP